MFKIKVRLTQSFILIRSKEAFSQLCFTFQTRVYNEGFVYAHSEELTIQSEQKAGIYPHHFCQTSYH